MRFYPNSDPYIYQEVLPNFNLYGDNSSLNWHRAAQQTKHSLNHWLDLKAAKMEKILHKDLCIKDWLKSRIRPAACLPIYYGTGIERVKSKENKNLKTLERLQENEKVKEKEKNKSKVQKRIFKRK